jgi:D-hydroxyproline dehydrogenase subunit beta
MNTDAIVVGAGIIGAAVADALSAAGFRVLVIDQQFAASGVTSAGMGHIVVMDDSPAQLALTSWSRSLLLDQAAGLSAACELDRCGTLWIAEDETQLEIAAAKGRMLREHGVGAELIDGEDLARAEPNLRRGLAGALLVPDDVVVYPPGLCAFLLHRAVSRGARLIRGTAVRSMSARAVTTEEAVLHAEFIVNAAGTAAPQLTPGLPIVPRRGHLVITDRHPGFCHHQLVELGYMQSAHDMTAQSVAFNVQPRATGQVLIGSSRELVGFDQRINRDIVSAMLERALHFMPSIGGLSGMRIWMGFRPATPDKLPLIGQTSAGVWIAAGHEGLGITTALGTGRLIADLMQERTSQVDPAPFAPDRAMVDA